MIGFMLVHRDQHHHRAFKFLGQIRQLVDLTRRWRKFLNLTQFEAAADQRVDPRAEGDDVIGPTGAVKVMVATKPVDFRKGAEGLAALVR